MKEFTAEAQRSQRSLVIRQRFAPSGMTGKVDSSNAALRGLCGLCASAVRIFVPGEGARNTTGANDELRAES